LESLHPAIRNTQPIAHVEESKNSEMVRIFRTVSKEYGVLPDGQFLPCQKNHLPNCRRETTTSDESSCVQYCGSARAAGLRKLQHQAERRSRETYSRSVVGAQGSAFAAQGVPSRSKWPLSTRTDRLRSTRVARGGHRAAPPFPRAARWPISQWSDPFAGEVFHQRKSPAVSSVGSIENEPVIGRKRDAVVHRAVLLTGCYLLE
jgi:hypothetical protein